MKKTAIKKIILLIIALATLIGSAICVSASAATTTGSDTYKIKAINISHGDRFNVLIAVDASKAEAENIKVTYTVGSKVYDAYYWPEFTNSAQNTTGCPIFYTDGVAAKDCGETMLVEAHKVGAKDYTPVYRAASVSDYLHTRLYSDGFIVATEESEIQRRDFYIDCLNYIASAQEVLWNLKYPNDQRTLVTDRVYVGTNKQIGYINDFSSRFGELKGNSPISLNYIGNGEKPDGWQVITINGTTIVESEYLYITESAYLLPYYDDTIISFESSTLGSGTTVTGTNADATSGKFASSLITDNGSIHDRISVAVPANAESTAAGNISTPGSSITVEKDASDRQYLRYTTGNKNSLVYKQTVDGNTYDSRPIYPSITVADVDANANVTVFEFDAVFHTASSSLIAQFGFYSGKTLTIYPYVRTSESNIVLYDSGAADGSTSAKNVIVSFKKNVLVNVRYEYYFDEGVTHVYVDDLYMGTITNSYNGNHAKPDHINWASDSSSMVDVSIYSIKAKNIYKSYEENPVKAPVYESFDSDYTSETIEWYCTNGTFVNETAEGGALYGQVTADTAFSAEKMTYKNNLVVSYTATSLYSKVHDAVAEVLNDSTTGNNYLSLYSPTRVSKCDRAYSISLKTQMLHPEDTENLIYVLDMDLKADSERQGEVLNTRAMEMIFGTKEETFAQFNFGESNNEKVVYHGAELGDWNEWNSLRFEIFPLEDSARIRISKKNIYGQYEYVHTWTDSTHSTYVIDNLRAGVSGLTLSVAELACINIDNVALYTAVGEYGSEITVVNTVNIPNRLDTKLADEMLDSIETITEQGIVYKTDLDEWTGTAVIIGDSTNAVTVAAKSKLESKLTATEDVGYTILVDGETVAVYWNDFRVCEEAIAAFESAFITSDSFTLADGYELTEVYSLDDYLAERGDTIKDEAWAELEAAIPEEYRAEIMASLEELYTPYNSDVVTYDMATGSYTEGANGKDDMIEWLASLYIRIDSETLDGSDVVMGGWFCSSGSRDNPSLYGPNLEDTYSALAYMKETGMAEMFNGDWGDATPEWLSEAVCNWFEALMADDGYFYHPQWCEQYITDNGKQSRITRDYSSGRTVLKEFGRDPDAAVAVVPASYALTGRMGTSSAVAVSKAVYASTVMDEYESIEAFDNYLLELDASVAAIGDKCASSNGYAYFFYSKGNEFQSTTRFMTAEMKEHLAAWFDKYQQSNGMWCKCDSQTPCYNATNALHKIASVYNSLGAELNNTDAMVDSTITILSYTVETNPAGAGVDVYNAWSCFPYIYQNIRQFSTDMTTEEKEAKILEYQDLVFANAATLISNGAAHIAQFRNTDGAYGYSQSSGSSAQGCPAQPGGVADMSDINGNSIATTSMIVHIFSALGLSDYQIPMFTEADRALYVELLEYRHENVAPYEYIDVYNGYNWKTGTAVSAS